MKHLNIKHVVRLALILVASTFVLGSVSMANAKTYTVEIKGFAFSVAELKVKVGDEITWINMDGATHTATATDKSWSTGNLSKGQSKTIKVTKGMFLEYFCNIHRGMKAKLVLK